MDFTARNVAKYVVKTLVATTTSKKTEDIITDYTRFEEDDTVVTISSYLVGWYVAEKLKPVTDKIVDTTADRIVAFREKRQDKTEK